MAADPKGKARARESDDEDAGEIVKSAKSLMKHALMMRGTRDTSAQLFTALCRALGIPARLMVSLQSVPWQASVGKPKAPAKKKGGKGKGKAVDPSDEDDEEMEKVEISAPQSAAAAPLSDGGKTNGTFSGEGQRLDGQTPAVSAKGKQKAPPVIKLRKSRGRKLGSGSADKPQRRERTPDPATTPPVFWTEVFSRADARWLPIDPIRCIINKRKAFDPTPHISAKQTDPRLYRVENRMVYVLAFEEDGFARDVTPRYAREYGAKVAKVQQGGKGRKEWWERILNLVKRPYRLVRGFFLTTPSPSPHSEPSSDRASPPQNRDDLEDDELQINQLTEAMPTTMAGFKDHPLYVLERHLKRDQVIHPLVELGKFRGEAVYPRSSVVALKTAENWMRQGRTVREGAQPMKWVKQRAMTVNKQRAIEMALAEGKSREDQPGSEGFASQDGVMQGMYAESQTVLYTPDPVVNGKVPKNDFGNIDLYVPTMLPAGAVHVPYKGTAKVARQLGFDYAEAVTGFEFKKRRAFPVITGIVVAAENEDVLLEAYWEAEHDAEEKRRAKQQEQVLKRWTRLVHGLRIRQRLQEQYAGSDQLANRPMDDAEEDIQGQGGFLTGADAVVQRYTLPRTVHEAPQPSTTVSLKSQRQQKDEDPETEVAQNTVYSIVMNDLKEIGDGTDEDNDMEEVIPPSLSEQLDSQSQRVPKTMFELAEEAIRQHEDRPGEHLSQNARMTLSAPDAAPGLQLRRSKAGAQTTSKSTTARGRKVKMAKQTPNPDARGKKRAREDDESSDPASEGENGRSHSPSTIKRARKAPAVVPASTRVLRTRRAKSASQIQEEQEREKAYRKAIAG
ncbi:uncharacterized protein FIBRA_07109 [Fibroporia radiculosa]|uniref:Rad4 beta-hairpin domain-containing protein n=1 Tax=Fibroporia radiculosa TaxID=599839 RepID=J4I065_9APHY|nr:uncharacterized protein FIBRA_07109 [Fibroporia radiculosa]CCM04912.1 predicted protein [Fibroporia radiculosa]